MQPSMSSHAALHGSHATVHELSCIVPWLLMQPSMSSHASSMAPHATVHGLSCNRPWRLMAAEPSPRIPSSSPPPQSWPRKSPSCCFLRKTLKSGEAKKKKASHQWRSRGLGATRAAFFLGPPRKKVAPGSGAPAREVPKKTALPCAPVLTYSSTLRSGARRALPSARPDIFYLQGQRTNL
jgi:hypothetical protein